MALTQDFTTYQTVGYPSIITIEDTSTGTDAEVTQRRVTLVDYQGGYVVPSGTTTTYVDFPIDSLSGDTLDIDCLTSDKALSITVQWLDVNNVVLYSKTYLKGFTLYNESFYYSLTQSQATQASPPNIIQDTLYYSNKMILRVEIDAGNQAISYGSDIVTAQSSYDRATKLRLNENYYF